MKRILQTSRCNLREFAITDVPFVLTLVNDPDWIKYIGDKNIHSEEDAESYIRNGPMKSYSENGFGLLVVESKEGESMGMCGLIKRPSLDNPDLGFAFLPAYRDLGLASESARACLKYGLSHLGMKTIHAITHLTNDRSIRLLEKIGMKFSKIVYLGEDDTGTRLFTINSQNNE